MKLQSERKEIVYMELRTQERRILKDVEWIDFRFGTDIGWIKISIKENFLSDWEEDYQALLVMEKFLKKYKSKCSILRFEESVREDFRNATCDISENK